ncbi:MAG: hypothetical protein GC150_05575 [Rhizobiales bacterium]|nr:hypothetical protein [Hyphomicrobiales bacterium]
MMLDVVVLGSAMTPFRRSADGSSARDWVRAVARSALDDAGLTMAAIDAVVVASESDHLSLQLSAGALMNDEIGGVPRPVMRIEAGGASGAMAVRAGVMHIASGLADRVLVVGFEHAASHLSGADVRFLYGLSFDADLEGFAGADATSLYALSAGAFLERSGLDERDLASVSVKNHGNARFNPDAHKPMAITIDDVLASPPVAAPYKRLDCSLISDGAAAVVLACGATSPTGVRPRVAITASGAASDHVRLGDRADIAQFAGKAAAAAAAYRMAGIADPGAQIDIVECYDAYTGAELQGLVALGLAEEAGLAADIAAGRFERGGPLPVNLSGGLIGQGGAPGAVGIAQVHTLTRLLQGRYHDGLQPARRLRRGIADAHGGVATVNVVHVLECID